MVVIAVAIVISVAAAFLWGMGYVTYEVTGFDWWLSTDNCDVGNVELGALGLLSVIAIVVFCLLCYGGKEAGDWLFNSIKNKKKTKKAEVA